MQLRDLDFILLSQNLEGKWGCCWFYRFSSQNANSLELSAKREEDWGQTAGERVKSAQAVNKVKHMTDRVDAERKMEFCDAGPATAPSN